MDLRSLAALSSRIVSFKLGLTCERLHQDRVVSNLSNPRKSTESSKLIERTSIGRTYPQLDQCVATSRGLSSVAQTTGITVADEFENFVRSDRKMKVVFRVLREAVRIFL